tara:strand:- start:243 stop:479 length:237 start_codon:yes stop_codon:yes gene_type:complete
LPTTYVGQTPLLYSHRSPIITQNTTQARRPIGQVAKVKQVYVKDSDNVVKKLDEVYVKKDSSTVEKIHQTVNNQAVNR